MSQEAMHEGAAGSPLAEIQTELMKQQRRPQREILLEVLRIAAQYETWVTLEELAGKTKFPPASISAQLRHLRKARYGGWTVERRRRKWVEEELVWEYRLGG
jgi:hypothetical protein